MATSKGPSDIISMMYKGKNPLLPPKIPLSSGISQSYIDYVPSSTKAFQNPREENSHHQRTSSERFLMDEQPSWLDELLDEPDTPVHKGHRRSTSDSVAYLDTFSRGSMSFIPHVDNELKNITPFSLSGSQNTDIYGDTRHGSLYVEGNLWDTPPATHARTRPPRVDAISVPNVGSQSNSQDAYRNSSSFAENLEPVKSGHHDPKNSEEKRDSSHNKSSETEADTRRAKQRYAQHSRVQKLQYITELERNVQALQAEGSDVSSELEFLNQQNLILNVENNALKQRLENLSQEQLIKHLEHEVLEREVGRLRNLYVQLQQPQPQQEQQKYSTHRRAKSKDLDQQFNNLSLKHREPSPGRDSVSSHVRT